MKIKKKIKKIFSRIFPERFENYWKKIKNSESAVATQDDSDWEEIDTN